MTQCIILGIAGGTASGKTTCDNFRFWISDCRLTTTLPQSAIKNLQSEIHCAGRTLDAVIEQYERTVRPMHLEFVEPSKRYADVIIPEGGHNTIALDMVVARIESMLQAGV